MYNEGEFQKDLQQTIGQLLLMDAELDIKVEDFACKDHTVQAQVVLPWPISAAWWAQCMASLASLRPALRWSVRYTSTIQGRAILPTQQALPGVKNCIGIAAGKGGVGKSTVAVGVARALCRAGASVGVLDVDIYGPSVPVLLGINDQKTSTKDQQFMPIVIDGLKVQSMATLVDADDALIWRGPMASKAVEQLAYQTLWGDLDYLIVDLPPGTGDIALTVSKKLPLTAAALVSTAHALAVADVQRCHAMMKKMQIPMLGVVENMSHITCLHCDQKHPMFGQENHLLPWMTDHHLPLLEAVPFAPQDAQEPVFDQLAMQIAAGLCCLPVRRGVRMPEVVSA